MIRIVYNSDDIQCLRLLMESTINNLSAEDELVVCASEHKEENFTFVRSFLLDHGHKNMCTVTMLQCGANDTEQKEGGKQLQRETWTVTLPPTYSLLPNCASALRRIIRHHGHATTLFLDRQRTIALQLDTSCQEAREICIMDIPQTQALFIKSTDHALAMRWYLEIAHYYGKDCREFLLKKCGTFDNRKRCWILAIKSTPETGGLRALLEDDSSPVSALRKRLHVTYWKAGQRHHLVWDEDSNINTNIEIGPL